MAPVINTIWKEAFCQISDLSLKGLIMPANRSTIVRGTQSRVWNIVLGIIGTVGMSW